MRTLLLVLSTCFLLAGCKYTPWMGSERVDVPADVRRTVPGLEGEFWVINSGDDDQDFNVFIINRDDTNGYHVLAQDFDGTSKNLLDPKGTGKTEPIFALPTEHPDIVPVLVPIEYVGEQLTVYALLLRSRAGTWTLHPVIGDLESSIEGARWAYLNQVANRHGLEMPDRFNIDLEGDLTVSSLTALFSDPDFLGGLRLSDGDSPNIHLFPVRSARLPPLSDANAWWKPLSDIRLRSSAFPIARNHLAHPPDFAREYTIEHTEGTIDKVTVEAMPSGCYLVTEEDAFGKASIENLCLVPIDQDGKFLGFSGIVFDRYDQDEDTEGMDPKEQEEYRYSLIQFGANGMVSKFPIYISEHNFSKAINTYSGWIRKAAARRHGLDMDGSKIVGSLDAEKARDLFVDPQFQSGIGIKTSVTTSVTWYGSGIFNPAKADE